jgi:hypothetical protein
VKKFYPAFLLVFLFSQKIMALGSISIIAPPALMDTGITRITVADVQQLLKQACNCDVTLNNNQADVVLQLPDISMQTQCPPNRFQHEAKVAYYPYPAHDFKWILEEKNGQKIFILNADCWQGVSFGLYGLLQQQLGFSFYHPREMIVPHLDSLLMNAPFEMEAKALFDKKGFHLHTQHPLELTEQLHDGTIPNALEDIKQYIDWLVRNGQTYFEFCLLENIDRKVWIDHAKAMVDYGHQRGLIMAVDLSLHMIQQKTFQLYKTPPQSFRRKKKQIDKNLAWLNKAGWDIYNMEFATAEFVGGNREKKELLRLHIIDWLAKNSKAKLMGRKHVVKDENEMMAKDHLEMDSTQKALDSQRGILIHTVMFYDMTEKQAPVYENKDLRHMYDLMLKEKEERETWYYPESAYWITFDVSIPMLLLPYLNARLSDIDTCVKHDIPGHITFSSGWEWGYWLFDWSIAHWSWQYTVNGKVVERKPNDMIEKLFGQSNIAGFLKQHLDVQQKMLKDENLIQWLTAMTVTDEMPFGLSQNYEPRPPHFYKDIANNITLEQLDEIQINYIPQLHKFGSKTVSLCDKIVRNMTAENSNELLKEFVDALRVTGLRSIHRFYTLQYLLDRRRAEITGKPFTNQKLLNDAATVRNEALEVVKRREQLYRYPVENIGRKHYSHTAYQHGYLYSVSNLHFWNREEQQALKNKWNFLFMNMWDVFKIIGLKN